MHNRRVFAGVEIEPAEVLVLDVVQHVLVDGVGRSFPVQFENDHAAVVSGGKQVQGRVARQNPEPGKNLRSLSSEIYIERVLFSFN